jgi:hypothetical protein
MKYSCTQRLAAEAVQYLPQVSYSINTYRQGSHQVLSQNLKCRNHKQAERKFGASRLTCWLSVNRREVRASRCLPFEEVVRLTVVFISCSEA